MEPALNTEISRRQRDVSVVFWLGLPLGSLAMKFLTPLLGRPRWETFMHHEMGFVENVTVAFLVPAVIVSVLIFLRRRQLPRGIGWAMLLLGIAALYFAGEEISWGQHYFHFKTPEALAKVNYQEEFNIHNTWNIFNNVPRQLLLVAMIAAVILPLIFHRRFQRPDARKSIWYWLIPNYRVIPIALMAILLRLPDKIADYFPPLPKDHYVTMALIKGSGEFKEYCFALAIMLYLLSIYVRMGPKKAKDELAASS